MTNNFHSATPPDRIRLDRTGNEITIAIKWFDFGTIIITVFTFVWDIILFSTISDIGLTLLIFVVAGIVLTYYAIAKWVNWTYITASQEKSIVSSQPLSWFGDKKFEVSRLQQLLYKKETRNRGKRTCYVIYVDTGSSKKTKLIELDKEQEASFITTSLQEYFNLG
jgi:hypothetical protein